MRPFSATPRASQAQPLSTDRLGQVIDSDRISPEAWSLLVDPAQRGLVRCSWTAHTLAPESVLARSGQGGLVADALPPIAAITNLVWLGQPF